MAGEPVSNCRMGGRGGEGRGGGGGGRREGREGGKEGGGVEGFLQIVQLYCEPSNP